MDEEFRIVTIDGVEFKLGPDEEIESLKEFNGSYKEEKSEDKGE